MTVEYKIRPGVGPHICIATQEADIRKVWGQPKAKS
jgi:hypothetical protein